MRLPSTFQFLSLIILAVYVVPSTAQDHWPSWRGPNLDGIAPNANPPVTWSETENIKWKTPLPGDGQTTPIIWDDRIFLQAAIPVGGETTDFDEKRSTRPVTGRYQFIVLCLDRNSGDILWQKMVYEAVPHQGHHPSTGLAPYSPVTDGQYVWASFGSRGLYCFDFDGNLIWKHALIQMNIRGPFGEGSSPALADDAVIVVADHEDQSRIFAFEKETGAIRWEHDRDEPATWATPLPVKVNGRTQIVTSANNFIRSYDTASGNIIWQCSGLTSCAAPTPVISKGKVYCATGFKGNAFLAIELGHTGDLTGTDAVVWSNNENQMPHVPTPLIYKGIIYTFEEFHNRLSTYDAESGNTIIEGSRLDGIKQIYASPMAAAGRIYVPGREGVTLVLDASDDAAILATNTLDDEIDGSPAAIGNELYLRGRTNMYCIAAN